jgi:biotin carboxyl carrier protein
MKYSVRVGNENFLITTTNAGAGLAQINGAPAQADLRRIRDNLYHLILNGEAFAVQFEHGSGEVKIGAHTFTVTVEDERRAAIKKAQRGDQAETGITTVQAPMPGLIVRLEVRPGDVVKKGEGLVVIEAMKMENEIKSPLAGTVAEIMIAARTTVEKGAPLLRLKAAT